MIEAKHIFWAEKLFQFYIFRLLKKHFHAFHLLGEIPKIDPNIPVILIPNHSTWWDGFFFYLLNRKLFKRTIYLMMLESQLSKYHFFSKVGAYSVAPENPKKILQSLRYTIGLLKKHTDKKPIICIFPQGEM